MRPELVITFHNDVGAECNTGTQNMCFDFIYNFCVKIFLILRRIVHISSFKVPFILAYFNET